MMGPITSADLQMVSVTLRDLREAAYRAQMPTLLSAESRCRRRHMEIQHRRRTFLQNDFL